MNKALYNANIWNERLKELMKERGLSQYQLAKLMTIKYRKNGEPPFSQKAVSRWIRVGFIERKKMIGYPKLETMIVIADFFDVDIGYLLGETDSVTFDLASTAEYIGISTTAVQNIHKHTHDTLDLKYNNTASKDSLSAFLESEHLADFLDCLQSLYEFTSKSDNDDVNISLPDNCDEQDKIEMIVDSELETKKKREYLCYEITKRLNYLLDDAYALNITSKP